MKRLTIFSLTCLFSVGAVLAQQGVTQCGVPTGQPKFPLLTYPVSYTHLTLPTN